MMGLAPPEIWGMALWEYNAYVNGYEKRMENLNANCVLTGYYTAYYVNGGKKAKSPAELIKMLHKKSQSEDEGAKMIEKIKKMDQGGR